jgi:hypothetical protein
MITPTFFYLFVNNSGRLHHYMKLLQFVFIHPLAPSLRPLLLPYLFNIYHPLHSTPQVACLRDTARERYSRLVLQCDSLLEAQEALFENLRDFKRRIEVDVVRTDREQDVMRAVDGAFQMKVRRMLRAHVMLDLDLGLCRVCSLLR